MSYKIVKNYTPDMDGKDVLVFLKTNFQHIGTDARGKRCVVMDDDNYVYAMFPKRNLRREGDIPSCESYVKPEGDILTWRDKLGRVETCELDALAEDVPATWDEFSDLLTKLVVDNTVGDGVIVIEDAGTWQRLGAARRKLYRKQMGELVDGLPGRPGERTGQVYPLAMAE